jgi:hypothetical protein
MQTTRWGNPQESRQIHLVGGNITLYSNTMEIPIR